MLSTRGNPPKPQHPALSCTQTPNTVPNTGANMRTMQGIIRDPSSGIYYHVKNIPDDVQFAFDGKRQKWQSLRTRDPLEANFRAAPIAEKIERKIANTRSAIAK